MKKVFEGIGLITLVILSFMGTNLLALTIKEKDDVYIQIQAYSNDNYIEPIDAVITDNTIIPGISGSRIDVKKSYKEMKKINQFNESLLVYETIKPSVSIERKFSKYVISGNKNSNEVSLVFLVNDNDNIDSILSVLGNNKATFFIDGNWFENNNEVILKLINSGHIVGNLGYNKDYVGESVTWMNTIVTKVGNQSDTYCYIIDDTESLNRCAFNESYTIRPSIIIDNYPLIKVKENITNGSIISLEVNDSSKKELSLIIDYINSKGYKMVNIEKLLTE